MNFTKTLVLKENFTFLVTDESGAIAGNGHGLFSFDTRFLNRYVWDFGDGYETLLAETLRPDRAVFHYARIEGPSQVLGIRRVLELTGTGFDDRLTTTNTSMTGRTVHLRLSFDGDFADNFEVRGYHESDRMLRPPVTGNGRASFEYFSDPAFSAGIDLEEAAGIPAGTWNGKTAEWTYTLQPGESRELRIVSKVRHPKLSQAGPLSYDEWEKRFTIPRSSGMPDRYMDVLRRAVRDLRALMLFTEEGIVPAAGIPWFTAVFGRDSLITSYMILPWYPEVAEGTLRYLARYQGRSLDAYRSEEPGKIFHEIRWGELAYKRLIPHTPYYGTLDATPLFIVLLHEYVKLFPTSTLLRDLEPSWEAALSWMKVYGDRDGDGFLEFRGSDLGPGKGCDVQSWKDSEDSMSHADGSLATGLIAPAEVQGYAYRAARAAVEFYTALDRPEKAGEWERYALDLKERFDRIFWIDEEGIYALALDGEKRPLRVKSSNAGQLLWTGIVRRERAGRLVRTLMGDELFSGWGIRTLGTREVRYNPLSYHNGSVWPHDTALIARGMHEYGFTDEAGLLARALFDLAVTQADGRLPELVSGYERRDESPVPYPVACRPQAWDSAALPYLCGLL